MILAGDIGGTNTRLALFDGDQQPHEIREYSSTQYPGLEPIIEQYIRDTGLARNTFVRAGFGVAGPVEQGPRGTFVHGTNLSWGVHQSDLATSLGLPTGQVGILNDLAANALGATVVAANQVVVLQAGEEVSATAPSSRLAPDWVSPVSIGTAPRTLRSLLKAVTPTSARATRVKTACSNTSAARTPTILTGM